MLSWEAPRTIEPCTCHRGREALYRCVDCHETALCCKFCMVTSHTNLWFHYIEAWNGKFFKRYDLVSLDFVIQLGHEGARCPHLSPAQEPSNFVIGHHNGLHDCKIQYCHCPGAPDKVTQLLRSRIFPATRDSPRSAFTLSLLRTWHQLWLNAKMSTHHFMRALSRYTDNAFPAQVKVYLIPTDLLVYL